MTNAHEPEKVTVTLTKTWVDENDRSLRPTPDEFKALVHLTSDAGEAVTIPDATAVDNKNNTYTLTWASLPKYKPGEAGSVVQYSVSEDSITSVDHYLLYENGEVTKGEDGYTFTVTNTRKTAQVYLGKQVTGNMGDRSASFTFSVTASGETASDAVTYTLSTGDQETIQRSHGVPALLGTFPVGATVTITETDNKEYDETKSGSKVNEDVAITNVDEDDTTKKDNNSITFKVSDTGNTVTFYNNKTIEIDTGVPVEHMPYLLMIAAVMLLGVVSLVGYRSRKKRFE